MCLLYISEQGVSIKKISRRIYAVKDEEKLFEIQTRKISAVCLIGNIQVSTQALSLFADEEIPVTFICLNGSVKGEFMPQANKNLYLRYAQYKAASDEAVSFDIAKKIVTRKIKSYKQFYRKFQKNNEVENCRKIAEGYKQMLFSLENVEEYDELLGYEGSASRIHFANYGKFFKAEITFKNRSHYPPKDEANSLLSLGYTMLFKLINGMLHSAGLDIYNGFLHKEKFNRPSLTCDFEEIFRVNVVDAFVLKLCNLKMIKMEHFTPSDNGPRLTNEGLNIFFEAWKEIAYPAKGGNLIKEIEKEINWFIKMLAYKNSPEDVPYNL